MPTNQILYITDTELGNLIRLTKTNGQQLNTRYDQARKYVTEEWAVTAVLEMRKKR